MAGRHRLRCGDRCGFSRDGGCRAQGKAGGGRRKCPNTQQSQQRSFHQRPSERNARHHECIGQTPFPLEAPILATRRVTRSAATPTGFARRVRPVSMQALPDARLELTAIRGAGRTRTSQIQHNRASRGKGRGRFSLRGGGVGARRASGMYVPGARPLLREAARNRSNRLSARAMRPWRLEDRLGVAQCGSVRKVDRQAAHSSQQDRCYGALPNHRTGRNSLLPRWSRRHAFVAVDWSAAFVAWHLLRRDQGFALLTRMLRRKCRWVRAGTGHLHGQFGSILYAKSAERSRSGIRVAQVPDVLDQLRLVAHLELSVDRLQVVANRVLADVEFGRDGGNALSRHQVNQYFAFPVRE